MSAHLGHLYPVPVSPQSFSAFSLPEPQRGAAAFAAAADARTGTHLKRAEQALMAAKARVLRPFGLTVSQYAALMTLYCVPDQSAAQMARAASVTPQTMSQTLISLETRGLVTRSTSPLHRSAKVVALTDAGEALALQADKAAREVEERLGAALSESDRLTLRRLLTDVVDALEDRNDV